MKNSLQNYSRAVAAILLFAPWSFYAQTLVQPLGPDGGIVNVVRGTPNDSIVLIGTQGHGIYQSNTGGVSWMPTSLTAVTVNDIVFRPGSLNVVYAATNQGLYISNDGGSTWAITTLTSPVSCLAFYPPDPNFILAGDPRPSPQGLGVMRSVDGGVSTWPTVLPGVAVTSLVIDAGSSPAGIVAYAGTADAGVYTTSTAGASWNVFIGNNGLIGAALRVHCISLLQGILTVGTSFGQYVCLGGAQWLQFTGISIDDRVVQCSAIVGSQAASATYYVGTKGNEESLPTVKVSGGLYRSTTFGSSWALRFNATLDVNSIFIPASNPKKIYLGTSDGIYVSPDTGKSWTRQNAGMTNSIVRSVAVMNSNPQFMFAGVFGGGVIKSTNSGATWVPSNSGIENPYVRNVVADPKNNGVLFAASVVGLYKSSDTARTWKKVQISNIPHDSLSPYNSNFNQVTVKISPVSSSNLMGAALTGEFIKSNDGGTTWSSMVPPQPIDSAGAVEKLEFDPVSASTIYFTSRGVWRSIDFGATWTNITGDLPATVSVAGVNTPLVGIHPRIDSTNTGIIYISTIVGGQPYSAYKTTNGGVNWFPLTVKTFDISVDKTSPSTLFGAGFDGVYHSSDAGTTWEQLPADPTTRYFTITPDPTNSNSVYIGSTSGVALAEYGAFAAVEVPQTSFVFDPQQIGAPASKTLTFMSTGQKRLTVNLFSVAGSNDFSLAGGTTSLFADPGTSNSFSIQFTPKTAGTQQGVMTFSTNDVRNPSIKISVQGTGVAKILVTRTVLLETTHGISSNLTSATITQHLSRLIQALQGSGITVVSNQASFDPLVSPFDAILIAAPKKKFLVSEIFNLKQYVVNGGFVVMLGDTGVSEANLRLNEILTDFQWNSDAPSYFTGLAMNRDRVIDSTKNYLGDPSAPVTSAFVDSTHPFVKGVTTVIPFSGGSISVSAQGVPFLKGNATTVAIDTAKKITPQPVIAAMSQIGKGRILLIGDVDMWGDIKGPDTTALLGVLAGKNLQFALNVFGYVDNYSVKLPRPTPSDKYQIISIPYDLSNFSILDVLKDLGSIDKTKWRLYGRWTGTQYLEFPTANFLSFKRGEGYWLITKGEHTISLGSASLSSAQEFYPIKLDSGYNLIGNPFPYRVSWATSQRPGTDSVEAWLWMFNGTGFQKETNVMEPFTGYFLKSLKSGVTVRINPTEVTSPGSLPKAATVARSLSPGEWQFQIKASNTVARDDDNFAGVLQSATDEWDVQDFSEPPPAPTDYLMLSFNHRAWRSYPGRYAGDYQSIHQEGNFWDFDVASAKAEASVNLAFEKMGSVPAGFEVYLVDMSTERVIDLHSSVAYGFTMKKNEPARSFRLVVGTKKYVEQNTNGIPIVPLDYLLEQNFPNPFNPATEIRFTLGHSAQVQLEVFDLLGRKVRTLLNDVRPIGAYAVDWDGTSDSGMKAASGIYFYRIRAEEFVSTKKMVFLK